MAEAIILNNVVKTFGNGQEEHIAIDNVSLKIESGEIFSLVGPDGAGKTTIIRMMCGVLAPQKGTISVLGFDIRMQKDEIKKRIGYLSQRFSLYHDLTIDENIDFFAEIHKIKKYKDRKEELLQFTRLSQFRSRLAGQLSAALNKNLHSPARLFIHRKLFS